MSKTGIIIEREYSTRVRKKSFLLTTLVTPLLFAALIVIPSYLAVKGGTKTHTVLVNDKTGYIAPTLENTKSLVYEISDLTREKYAEIAESSSYDGLLIIEEGNPDPTAQMFFSEQPGIEMVEHIQDDISSAVEMKKLQSYNIEGLQEMVESATTHINIRTVQINASGQEKETSAVLSMILSYVFGFMLYMVILIFGTQVMRGVLEEKTNRIVEVVISSAKPFQVMMGKVVGIALVGLTQCLIWIVLTAVLVGIGTSFIGGTQAAAQAGEMVSEADAATGGALNGVLASLAGLNLPLILFSFVFYFVGGYLLYASLFAAVGSAVDNETDTQQFVTPITIPLILSIMILITIMRDPSTPLAFWSSIIPFTSPIVMMARVPYGVPVWELILSMVLLLGSIVLCVWIGARIYRTGILMYGKKTTWKELWKWLRYKN